jgi:hypothetical protein
MKAAHGNCASGIYLKKDREREDKELRITCESTKEGAFAESQRGHFHEPCGRSISIAPSSLHNSDSRIDGQAQCKIKNSMSQSEVISHPY